MLTGEKRCAHCGSMIDADSIVCTFCGHRLDETQYAPKLQPQQPVNDSDKGGVTMYSNVGGKIKGVAIFFCIIGIIVSCLLGLWLIKNGLDVNNSYSDVAGGTGTSLIIQGVLYLVIGSFGSWIGSLFMYAFGEFICGFGRLVEYSGDIAEGIHEIAEGM